MMDALVSIACGISIVAFAWHGAALIWTQTMAADFARYGLTRHRAIVGALHLVGSAGLLLGLWSRPILPLAAGGLALLMLIAIGFRMQVRDPLRTIVPAIAFCALNVFVVTATR